MNRDLVPLPNDAMRARRCSTMIFLLWAWEATLGGAVAWPVASIVQSAYGTHPRADAVLWESGAFSLLDLLIRRLPEAGALVAHVATVILLAAIAGLLPSAALLVCLAFTTRERRTLRLSVAAQAAVVAFVPGAILLAVTLVFQGSLVVSAATLAGLAREGFAPTLGDQRADLSGLLLLTVGLLLAALAGVTHDIARAAVVRFGAGAGEALRLAVRAVAPGSLVLFWSWGWRALASLALLAFGALLSERVGGRGGWALVTLFVVHQIIVGARVAFRASWLAKAMRVVDHAGRPTSA
jgi:hypothetical protein